MNDSMHELFGTGGVRVAIIGVLSVLALFLLAQTANAVQDFGRPGNPATDTITVSSNGQATVAPDVARITFTVQNTEKTVSAAQDKTTQQANDAIDYVKGQGIEAKDIKTLSYGVYPQYSYSACTATYCPPRTSTLTGYEVSETVQVTMRDLSKVGDMLSGLGKLEVQNISGPSFGLEDATSGKDAARADAIAKAKARAKVLSKQLGVRLGKIVNFSESSNNYPYPVAYDAGVGGGVSSTKAESAPNVPTGENTYTANVSITYEIR